MHSLEKKNLERAIGDLTKANEQVPQVEDYGSSDDEFQDFDVSEKSGSSKNHKN